MFPFANNHLSSVYYLKLDKAKMEWLRKISRRYSLNLPGGHPDGCLKYQVASFPMRMDYI